MRRRQVSARLLDRIFVAELCRLKVMKAIWKGNFSSQGSVGSLVRLVATRQNLVTRQQCLETRLIPCDPPYVKVLPAFLYSNQIIFEKISRCALDLIFRSDHCRPRFIAGGDELIIGIEGGVEKLVMDVNM